MKNCFTCKIPDFLLRFDSHLVVASQKERRIWPNLLFPIVRVYFFQNWRNELASVEIREVSNVLSRVNMFVMISNDHACISFIYEHDCIECCGAVMAAAEKMVHRRFSPSCRLEADVFDSLRFLNMKLVNKLLQKVAEVDYQKSQM